jgi:hypothetical protein
MIKSSKVSLKEANKNKRALLCKFIGSYRIVVQKFVDILWEMEKVPCLLGGDITSLVESNLPARAVQCAGKQASGIVRGTRTKHKRMLYVIEQLNERGEFKRARKLQYKYDKMKASKPDIKRVEAELDSRFVEINLD